VIDRQERYDEKLVQILQSSCSIFAEKGFHHATVRDVAAATGVSPAGLYYYFGSKEELLFLILDHSLGSLLGEVRDAAKGVEDSEDRLRAILRAHLAYFAEHRPEIRVLAQEWEALSGEFLQKILARQRKYAAMVIRTLKALRPGTSRKELRASAMALFGMMTWMYQWYVPGRDLPMDELANQFANIFLEGFLPRAGTRGARGPSVVGEKALRESSWALEGEKK
jgi:AcrR family transcriptional regulator